MTKFVQTRKAGLGGKFRNVFKTREIFFHDGTSLRRLTIGARLQFSLALTFFAILLWSIFAAAQFTIAATDPTRADIARMEREMLSMQADVQAIKQVAQARYNLTLQEVRRLGLDPTRIQAGVGGPLEEIPAVRPADPSFKALFMSWKKLEQLELGTIAIPSTEPVHGTAFTSGYGVRSDPFRGRAAMHAGIDLAGPMGTPIYATADGIVGRSQWVNGYGKLVELDHGRGIQTRYGHLSRSLVQPGQRVKRGEMIALMGSTGRSTGSHLHYEVRLDGKAVNPAPFMQSSNYLQTVQRRAEASAQLAALGGPETPAAD